MKKKEKVPPFAFLTFGYLGRSAEISLLSVDSIKPSTIYFLTDTSGLAWLEQNLIQKMHSKVVILKLDESKFDEVEIQNSPNQSYSVYGKERFSKLTAFKWQLIQKVFLEYEEEECFFSDLDVIWLSSPQSSDIRFTENVFLYAQDDSNLSKGRIHFCTGLMYWRNTETSLNFLRLLYQNQVEMLNSGKLLNDEQIFNSLRATNSELNTGTRGLNVKEYVIGHRFFETVLNPKYVNPIAFHANYVQGERAKFRRLRIISYRSKKNPVWMIYTLSEFVREIRGRLFKS